jgi:pyruvate formate lyase activating enzyme
MKKVGQEILFDKNKCLNCGGCIAVCENGAHLIDDEHLFDRNKCKLCFNCVGVCSTNALEILGEQKSISEIVEVVKRDVAFYGEKGGVTLSGGEPLMQGEVVVKLLKALKEEGLNTAVETCGNVDTNILKKAVEYVDLFLWDIKDTDNIRHKKYTGVSNELILKNLSVINEMNAKIRLRCILVNGVNTNATHYKNLLNIANKIKNLDGVEIIPYHAYGGSKALLIGLNDNGIEDWIPTSEQLFEANSILKNK